MSARVKLYRNYDGAGNDYVSFVCPGCAEHHTIPIAGPRAWQFNGDLQTPTLHPSILCRYHAFNEQTDKYDKVESVCHSFVRAGRIEFLGDCTHSLKGQTIDLPDVPES